MIDTPLQATLRERHIDRLQALANEWEEEGWDYVLERPRRAWYLESHWRPRIFDMMAQISMEPIYKALEHAHPSDE